MDMGLLRHLGVDERILRALEKSSGERFEALEIEQGAAGLRLILRYRPEAGLQPHTITLKDAVEAVRTAEPPAAYHAEALYACRDRLHFFPNAEAGRPNLILNGQKMRLGDALFRLMLHLARAMKEDGRGWVALPDLRAARLVPGDGYQVFSRLRSVVAGYLLEKNPRAFLEANGCKEYRLSVPPPHLVFES